MNVLARLVLGSGRLPEQLRARLRSESLILLEEGLIGSITWRDYRAPGQYANWRKDLVSGAIGISNTSLVVFAGRAKRIDLPLRHPRRSAVEVSLERPDRILFAQDAGAFLPDRSGRIEYRLRTAQAGHIHAVLCL
ncbi:MAG: hypothetical protein J2P15_03025 [Micromonosporaceae bacterium]|nr:hypothetical protein [Micromonosporaceae bacterium]